MHRRHFLLSSAGTVGAVFAGPQWAAARSGGVSVGEGPYGPLGAPDGNGIRLPEGFASRVVARGEEAVGADGYAWPRYPDGAATFPDGDGGWYHAVNSEIFVPGTGSASCLHYDADGEVVDAYRLVGGTQGNCAGGPTPWGTWLSCEEVSDGEAGPGAVAGLVWECDPAVPDSGEPLPALGAFEHEAVAVDPDGKALYLTEDTEDGGFYRFTPASYPDLAEGTLEIASVDEDGAVTWLEVPDPSAESGPCRRQVAEATAFDGGEGCWYDRGVVYFTTKGDDRVWAHDVGAGRFDVLYDAADLDDPPLRGVDNLIVEAGSGDVLVAEDGGDMQVVLITADGTVAPLLQITDEPLPDAAIPSEVTGLAFSPDGNRLYCNSQRGGVEQLGISYEITGPFRGPTTAADEQARTTTTLAAVGEGSGGDDDASIVPVAIGVGGAVGLAIGTGIALRRRRGDGAVDDGQ